MGILPFLLIDDFIFLMLISRSCSSSGLRLGSWDDGVVVGWLNPDSMGLLLAVSEKNIADWIIRGSYFGKVFISSWRSSFSVANWSKTDESVASQATYVGRIMLSHVSGRHTIENVWFPLRIKVTKLWRQNNFWPELLLLYRCSVNVIGALVLKTLPCNIWMRPIEIAKVKEHRGERLVDSWESFDHAE